ncbi:unnamed protein product [Rangifer tarandus platyrhynchus]|uniref:Uncharacterized protein n=1 Tax=Rangifer tarandus platyrhynchus TaxID=3082113 RepID=A0AC59Y3C3_RANTA
MNAGFQREQRFSFGHRKWCLQHSGAAGMGERVNPGPACPTCQDKPCPLGSARFWLVCFLGIPLLLGAFTFLSYA